MKTTKLLSFAGLVAFAMICLPAKKLPAQSPLPPEVIGNSLQSAVITSGSGATRPLNPYLGLIGRAGLRPNQLVTVTLQFSEESAGKPVVVSLLDGGEINPHSVPSPIEVTQEGTASFVFKGGNTVGRYRLQVRFKTEEYLLEFRVIDPVNLQNNPPRFRIVD
jgi:hypothetical protein